MPVSLDSDILARLDLSAPERVTLDEQVYSELRDRILSGRVRPGESLSIRPLAQALDVSPMPVRAALRRLTAEGALEGRPNRTFTIRTLTPVAFEEIARIRILLEGDAAERAATRLSPADIAELAAVNDLMYGEGAAETEQFLTLNRRFHFRIYESADSPLLLRFIEGLWLQIGPLLNLVVGQTEERWGKPVHDAALVAARQRDGPALRAAVQTDIREAVAPILGWLARGEGRKAGLGTP